jgi:flagellar hook-length control protein FliK
MMQNVATTKSEVAAFATGTQTSSFTDSGANEQFGRLLQEQRSTNSVVVNSENSSPKNSNKKAAQQPEANIKNDLFVEANQNTSKDRVKANDEQIPNTSQDKAVTDSSDGSVLKGENVDDNLKDELKVTNTNAEQQSVSSSNQNDIESGDESANIVAQEWVLLIDNLNRLADITHTSNPTLVEQNSHQLEVSVDELKLSSKIENALSEEVGEGQFVDNLRLSIDDITLLGTEDKKVPSEHIVSTKKQTEQTISSIVDKALGEVLAAVEGETEVDIPQKTAKLILEQPLVLKDLINQLRVASQESDTDSTEQQSLDTTTDSAVKKDSQLINQQADLTLAENKDLLKTLVVEIDTNEPDKLVKANFSDTLEKLAQTQQAEVETTKLNPIAEKAELIEQDVQMTQVAANIQLNVNKTDKAVVNNDLKSLLNLSDSKLDKVLENIAQRVFDSKNAGESISPEQLAQQVVMPKSAEIISSLESSTKDFISALKSGLEEFKNQLSQGREPGIDLKALMAEALAKTTDPASVAKTPVNLEQIASSVSQVLDLAQSMSRTIENRHDQAYSATLRDVAQIQGEQSKQIQLNQVESRFEKAINIAKPEGHQQLAEKVRWMVNTKNLVAEIRLDPAELGSVHVKVSMSGESATVNFVVQSQQARDAVDTATPRLREMLAEKGIELGQSSVRQESDGQQGHGDGELAKQGGRANGESEETDMSEQVLAQQNIVNGALGGIDYFV